MSSSFEGTLESGQLLDILRSIAGRRASGLLSVQGEPDLVSITFLEGSVVAADAMNRPAEDVLAGVLASRGLLSPADFSAAVEPSMGTGQLASEALLEQGKVPREDLLDAVREQTYGQLVRLLRWESGNFNWTEGAESPYQEGMAPISVAEAMVRSTEELGVEGPLSSGVPELDASYGVVSGAGGCKVVGRDGDWIDGKDGTVWLTPDEVTLLELLERESSAHRLVEATGWDRYRVEFGLFQLLAVGLVSLGAWEDSDDTDDLEVGDDTAAQALVSPFASTDIDSALDELASDVSNLDLEGGGEEPSPVPEESAPSSASGNDELDLSTDLGSAALAARPPAKRAALAQVTSLWAARALALGLVGLLATLLLVQAERPALLLPFPWQADARSSLEKRQTLSRYQKIDRAVRTYYLLYGRPPESLATLSDLELLAPGDLYDPLGRWLSYTGRDTGYVVQPVEGGEVVPGSELAADSRSDFFLNPKFVDLPEQRPDPVVLID